MARNESQSLGCFSDVSKEYLDDSKDTFNPGGGKEGFHGVMFQLRLIIMFLIRGMKKYNSFSIASEQKEADKFDDLIFRYIDANNKRKFRFIQCKHRGDSSKKISLQGLLSTSTKGDFSLLAYFESFRKIIKHFHPQEIEHLILCTNIGFKNRDRREEFRINGIFEPIKNGHGEDLVDDLLQCKILKFKKSFHGRDLWIDHFKKYSKDQKNIQNCIELFLEKLAFAVEHPGVEELKVIINNDLRDMYHVAEPDMAYIWIEREINDWMTKTTGTYLREVDGKKYMQLLQKSFGSIKFEFRDPVNNFIGREKELSELKISQENGVDTVIITGLGGIGKSQLAKKFIASNSYLFDSIVWLNAENQQSLIHSLKRLAFDRLNIVSTTLDGRVKDVKSIMEEIYQYFLHRKAIFVFDNVENLNCENEIHNTIEDFLPKSSPKPFVIITSRYQNWGSLKVIKLQTFSEEETMNLIKLSTGFKNFDQEKLRVLANQLECFPLAIQQAIAFLSEFSKESRLYTGDDRITNYMQLLEKESSQIFNQAVEKFRGDDYEKTTLTTWNVTLKVIQGTLHGDLSFKILKILSYFAPDGIPLEDIDKCFPDVGKESLKSALSILHDYSMITIERDVSIHRLVQFVTRMVVTQSGEEEYILRIILLAHSGLKIDNLLSVWNYAIMHKALLKEFSMIPMFILSSLEDQSRFEEGYYFWTLNEKHLRKIFSQSSKIYLSLLEKFANIAQSYGKYEEAKSAYANVIQNSTLSDGNEDGRILENLHNIATLLHSAGKYEKAIKVYRLVLSKQQHLLGFKHPDTLRTMNNTASALRAQSQYEEAISLYREVYCLRKALLSKNHPDVLNTLHCIACTLADHGDYMQAYSLYEKILRKQIHVLGETHSDTLNTMKNIAIVLQNEGNFDKAKEIFEDVLQKQTSFLPPDHPEILNTIENIENLQDDRLNHTSNSDLVERNEFQESSDGISKNSLKKKRIGWRKYLKRICRKK